MGLERRTADFAQAVALLLVILYHINDLTINNGESHWRLWYIYNFAEPILMPFFFFLAGGSAGRVLAKKSKKSSRNRIAAYVWLYLFWTLIYIIYGFMFTRYNIQQLSRCSDRPIACLLMPINPLWFLHHLIIYLTLSYFFPPNGKTLLVTILTVQTILYFFVGWYISRFFSSLVFFVVGFFYIRPILQTIAKISSQNVVAICALYILLVCLFYKIPNLNISLSHNALSLVGIIVLLKTSKLVAQSLCAAPIIYIGRYMLPIYLLHWVVMFPIVLIYHSFYKYAAFAGRAKALTQVLGPFILLAATVLGSLIIYRYTKKISGLYVPSKALVRRTSEIALSFRDKFRATFLARWA